MYTHLIDHSINIQMAGLDGMDKKCVSLPAPPFVVYEGNSMSPCV